ncbi:MAG: hypothetical protein ACI8TQ_002787 [Planctomycetota bacterium]|jgi:hypothetical protein
MLAERGLPPKMYGSLPTQYLLQRGWIRQRRTGISIDKFAIWSPTYFEGGVRWRLTR